MIRTYIFSGLISSIVPAFRSGTDDIANHLNTQGSKYTAKTYIWNQWEDAVEKIYNDYMKDLYNNESSKIALVGHSNGVLACAHIANKLQDQGIPVHYIAAIDPTAAKFPSFKGNVKAVDEFHATSGYPALRRKFSKNRARCTFFNPWYGRHIVKNIKAGHIAISSLPEIQSSIWNNILSLGR